MRECGYAIELFADLPFAAAPLDLEGRSRIVAAATVELCHVSRRRAALEASGRPSCWESACAPGSWCGNPSGRGRYFPHPRGEIRRCASWRARNDHVEHVERAKKRMSATEKSGLLGPLSNPRIGSPTKGVTLKKNRHDPFAAKLVRKSRRRGIVSRRHGQEHEDQSRSASANAGVANVTVSDDLATLAAAGPGKATDDRRCPVPQVRCRQARRGRHEQRRQVGRELV